MACGTTRRLRARSAAVRRVQCLNAPSKAEIQCLCTLGDFVNSGEQRAPDAPEANSCCSGSSCDSETVTRIRTVPAAILPDFVSLATQRQKSYRSQRLIAVKPYDNGQRVVSCAFTRAKRPH